MKILVIKIFVVILCTKKQRPGVFPENKNQEYEYIRNSKTDKNSLFH